MNTINSLLTRLADLVFAPLANWPPQWSLVLVSAVTGVLMAWVFKHTSNQRALAAAANHIRAQLFAIKLFKDDLGVTFRSQVELFKATGWRLWHSLPPMLVMLVPLVLLLVQLALRFEHRPLKTGETAIVELHVAPDAWGSLQSAQLDAPESIVVETPALRDAARSTIYWRIRAQSPATDTLRFTAGDLTVDKSMVIAEDTARLVKVSEQRGAAGFFDRWLHPAEPAFASDSPVRAIVVGYPQRSTPLFGYDVPWWLTFFLVSMLAAVLARPWLRVQF